MDAVIHGFYAGDATGNDGGNGQQAFIAAEPGNGNFVDAVGLGIAVGVQAVPLEAVLADRNIALANESNIAVLISACRPLPGSACTVSGNTCLAIDQMSLTSTLNRLLTSVSDFG